jgi:hypothetical protein
MPQPTADQQLLTNIMLLAGQGNPAAAGGAAFMEGAQLQQLVQCAFSNAFMHCA